MCTASSPVIPSTRSEGLNSPPQILHTSSEPSYIARTRFIGAVVLSPKRAIGFSLIGGSLIILVALIAIPLVS